ncbi:hypothetical protein EGW08_000432 [Elysia chlorotica]|uniref:Uncharacterized protein n=1 Tax=Elysia chlorotica TaxID=188477 RepID=A0A3S1I463_ELYCH|nr:hypothetical protein EGW08_000432 [Elysia chlorotica]
MGKSASLICGRAVYTVEPARELNLGSRCVPVEGQSWHAFCSPRSQQCLSRPPPSRFSPSDPRTLNSLCANGCSNRMFVACSTGVCSRKSPIATPIQVPSCEHGLNLAGAAVGNRAPNLSASRDGRKRVLALKWSCFRRTSTCRTDSRADGSGGQRACGPPRHLALHQLSRICSTYGFARVEEIKQACDAFIEQTILCRMMAS